RLRPPSPHICANRLSVLRIDLLEPLRHLSCCVCRRRRPLSGGPAASRRLAQRTSAPLKEPHDYTGCMRRGRWSVIAAVFAIAAAAAVTAGCGGGTSNALSLDPVAAAATKTQEAGAARLRFTIALGSPQLHGGKLVRLTGTGAIDGTSGDVTFSMGSKGSAEVISLQQNGDYVLYVQLAALSAKLPGGKRWVELDLSKLGSAAGLDLGKLLSGSQLQPSDLLSMLQANGGKLSNLGPATVDGVATTHYRATIDVAKALQAKGLTSPLLDGLASRLPTVPED